MLWEYHRCQEGEAWELPHCELKREMPVNLMAMWNTHRPTIDSNGLTIIQLSKRGAIVKPKKRYIPLIVLLIGAILLIGGCPKPYIDPYNNGVDAANEGTDHFELANVYFEAGDYTAAALEFEEASDKYALALQHFKKALGLAVNSLQRNDVGSANSRCHYTKLAADSLRDAAIHYQRGEHDAALFDEELASEYLDVHGGPYTRRKHISW